MEMLWPFLARIVLMLVHLGFLIWALAMLWLEGM